MVKAFKLGTDVALLNALANVIITKGLANLAFIQSRTEDYETFKENVMECIPEYAEAITGVPAQKIIEAASIIGRADNGATYYTMGVTQHTSGVDNVLSIANLALLTGNVGKVKAGVNPLRG